MKKLRLIIATLIIAASLFSFSACTPPKAAPTTSIMLLDFENYVEATSSVKYNNYFGKVELNEDSNYVTSGAHCGKLIIRGNPSNTRLSDNENIFTPYIKIYSDTKTVKKLDLLDVNGFAMDIFNPEQIDRKVNFAIEYTSALTGSLDTYFMQEKTVKAGVMNKLVWPLDRVEFDMQCEISEIKSYKVIFEDRLAQDAPDYILYLDNVRAMTTEQSYLTPTKTGFADNEIFNFESTYDASAVQPMGFGSSYKALPQITVNTDMTYVEDGRKSLKLETKASPLKAFLYQGWVGFQINAKNLKHIDFAKYDKSKASIEMKIYNQSAHEAWLFVSIADRAAMGYKKDIRIQPGSSAKLIIPFSELKTAQVDMDRLKVIQITMEEKFSFDGFGNTTLYIDNMKIVQTA